MTHYRDHFVYQKIALDDLLQVVDKEVEGWSPLMSVYARAVKENEYWLPDSTQAFLSRAFKRPWFDMKPTNKDYEISRGDRERLRTMLDFLLAKYRTCIQAFDTALAVQDFRTQVENLPHEESVQEEGEKKAA